MRDKSNIFLNKKILIYGLARSGLSAFQFFKKKNSDIFLYDDFKKNIKNSKLKKNLINYRNVLKSKFDKIILSPGIDINKCKLSKFLKKNKNKIYSDLDVFFAFYKNDCITITGTNGKSTTCQLLYEILLKQRYDAKLVGNIGAPILSVKNVKKKTIFVIEASSYQLEYSKIFRSKCSVILNLSPDHIERHKTINRYVKAKFRLLKNQLNGHYAFIKKDDLLIKKEFRANNFNSKIIRVDTRKVDNFLKKINNNYFMAETNNLNGTEFLGYVDDADVYSVIGSNISFHDRDASYSISAGDYFVINSREIGTDVGEWGFTILDQQLQYVLVRIDLPPMQS